MPERARDPNERIVRAAVELLTRGGREAVTTRAVSAAAGVQAPTIYRQFGDMSGLLRVAARRVMGDYVRLKALRNPIRDPVEALRHGWDTHVAFGLANPAAYALIYSDWASAGDPPEMREGHAVLEAIVVRVAEAGRLRVPVPQATRLIGAAGCGVTLALLSADPDERDLSLSDSMREIIFASILGAPVSKERGPGRAAALAVALRAVLVEADDVFSESEQRLFDEWLGRLATAGGRATASRGVDRTARRRERSAPRDR